MNSIQAIIIFSLASMTFVFVNVCLSKVMIYPKNEKMTWKIKLNIGLLFLGKIQFLIVMSRFILYGSESNIIYTLFIFIVNGLLILDDAYYFEGKIIRILGSNIAISDIKEMVVFDSFIDTKYLKILIDGKEKKIKLSKQSFDQFKRCYSEHRLWEDQENIL